MLFFLSDNGATLGQAGGGSNWPLRGSKFTPYEGGVRVPAFVHSPYIPLERRGSTCAVAQLHAARDGYDARVAETTRARARHRRLALSMWQSVGKTRAQALLTCRAVAPLPPISFRRDFLRRYGGLFHVTDLLPTALELAGASKMAIAKFELDGVSQMAAVLDGDATDAPRDSMLLHADKCVETTRHRRTERGDRDPSRRHRGRPSRGQARGASRARPRDRLLFATRERRPPPPRPRPPERAPAASPALTIATPPRRDRVMWVT